MTRMPSLMLLQVPTAVMVFCLVASRCNCDDNLNFMVVGDWGGVDYYPFSTYIERSVANTMNTIAEGRDTKFQVSVGDNIYWSGVTDVNDPRFVETFENVFTGEYLQNDWYIVAGNHDWKGNMTAQLEYSKHSPRWKFPSYYYTKSAQSADGATLDIVMIDTIILCGMSESDFVAGMDLELTDKDAADVQFAWIENVLANSKADYVLVAGHYPVYSIASHGPTQCLIDRLCPMLFKYKVTSYLCGHDHNLQHLTETEDNQKMDYFIIGSSAFATDSREHSDDVPKGSLKFYNADDEGGFGLVSFNKQQMQITFISGANKELYASTMEPRNL